MKESEQTGCDGWLFLYVNLTGLWCQDIWSNIILDVPIFGWNLHLIGGLWVKQIAHYTVGGPFKVNWRLNYNIGLNSALLFEQAEILQQKAFNLHTQKWIFTIMDLDYSVLIAGVGAGGVEGEWGGYRRDKWWWKKIKRKKSDSSFLASRLPLDSNYNSHQFLNCQPPSSDFRLAKPP